MVFESVVVDILNRYLKPYVKRLDTSQLKVGVWKGHARLEKLELKEDLFAEANLDVPLKIRGSYIGKLDMKIPWKRLTKDPLVITIDEVYIIVGPELETSYDPEKELKRLRKEKEKKIEEFEEASKKKKQKEKEAKKGKKKKKESDKPDSFTEKMVAHLMKNLLVKVRDIHVRYEDSVTNPNTTIAAGITLHSLELKSTDENWKPTIVRETATLIYKLLELNCLGFYWTTYAQSLSTLPITQLMVEAMRAAIARPAMEPPPTNDYLLMPMSATARLKMNLKPEADLSIPQLWTQVECEDIDFILQEKQYKSLLTTLDSFDRHALSRKYLKYKQTDKPPREDLGGWWRYAITSVLEEDVKRRTRMWSWKHIKQHREVCRLYRQKYQDKIHSLSPSSSLLQEIQDLEDQLDWFNIVMCRKKEKHKAKKASNTQHVTYRPPSPMLPPPPSPLPGRSPPSTPHPMHPQTPQSPLTLAPPSPSGTRRAIDGGKKKEKEKKKEGKKKKGFFSNLRRRIKHGDKGSGEGGDLGGGGASGEGSAPGMASDAGVREREESVADVAEEQRDADREEKERREFYQAIGYSEDEEYMEYPKEYVAQKVFVTLNSLSLDLLGKKHLGKLSTRNITATVFNRPTTRALSVSASVRSMDMTGVPHGSCPTSLLSSQVGEAATTAVDAPLLKFGLELNPLDRPEMDVVVRAELRPIKITYDAETVDGLIGVFKPQKNIHLQELTQAASASWDQLKTQTTAGLQNALKDRKQVEIDVTLQSPFLVVPDHGLYSGDASLLVVDLGRLSVVGSTKNPKSLRKSTREAGSMDQFYDKFTVQLAGMQVLVAKPGEDWKAAMTTGSSPLHVLDPTGFEVELQKSIVDNSAYLPSLRVEGTLPRFEVKLSDEKLATLVKVGSSLEKPPSLINTTRYYDELPSPQLSRHFLDNATNVVDTISLDTMSVSSFGDEEEEEDTVSLYSAPGEREAGDESKFDDTSRHVFTDVSIKLCIKEIALKLTQMQGPSRKFRQPILDIIIRNMYADVVDRKWDTQGSVSMGEVTVLDYITVDSQGGPTHLLQTEALHDGNFISTRFVKVTRLGVDFAAKYTGLQNSMSAQLSLIKLKLHRQSLATLMHYFMSLKPAVESPPIEETEPADVEIDQPTAKINPRDVKGSSTKSEDFHFDVEFDGIDIALAEEERDVVQAAVKGFAVKGTVQKDKTTVSASMEDLEVVDPSPEARIPQIVSKVDKTKKMITLNVVTYNKDAHERDPQDLSWVDTSLKTSVERISVHLDAIFLVNLLEFVKQLNINQEALQTAAKATAGTAVATATAIKESTKSAHRVKLDVTLRAPLVVLPYRTKTTEGEIYIDLGDFQLSNDFLHSSQLLKGEVMESCDLRPGRTTLDRMKICTTSIQIYRLSRGTVCLLANREQCLESARSTILEPLEFTVHVTRNISGPSMHFPNVDVQLGLGDVKFHLHTEDVTALLTIGLAATRISEIMAPPTKPKAAPKLQRRDTNVCELESAPSGLVVPPGGSRPKSRSRARTVSRLRKGDSMITEVKVQATMKSVSLDITTVEGPLLIATSSGLRAQVDVFKEKILVTGSVDSLSVVDLGAGVKHRKVVSLAEGTEKVSSLELKVFLNEDRDPMSPHGEVKANVAQIQLTLLVPFVLRVVDFARRLQINRHLIVDAAKAAQDSAVAVTTLTQDKYFNMDILVHAPVLVLPVSEESPQGFMMDFGSVSIQNTLIIPDHTAGHIGIDAYGIKLDSFKVSRVILDYSRERSAVVAERVLLQPFHMLLAVERNLCPWYISIPTLNINCTMGELQIFLGREDLECLNGFVMRTVESVKVLSKGEHEMSGAIKEGFSSAKPLETLPSASPDQSESDVENYTKVQVFALLTKFEFKLFDKEPKLAKNDSSSMSLAKMGEYALASLQLVSMELNTKVSSNGDVDVGASVKDIALCDEQKHRQGRNTGNRVIQHYTSNPLLAYTGKLDSPIVSISYLQRQKEHIILLRGENLLILSDLEFLQTIIEYFKAIFAKPKQQEPEKPTQSGDGQSTDDDSSIKKKDEQPVVAHKSFPKIKVEASIKNFRVAIIETVETIDPQTPDSSEPQKEKDPQPQALTLKVSVYFHVQLTESNKQMSLNVADLGISTSSFFNLDDTTSWVLLPCSMMFSMVGPLDKPAMDITGMIESVNLNLSPPVVRLIIHAVQALIPQKDKEKRLPPQDLWEKKSLDDSKLWFLSPVPLHKAVTAGAESEEKGETLTLTLESIEIILESESTQRSKGHPVLALNANAVVQMFEWTGELTVNGDFHCEASYYNEKLSVWEPLLEPLENSNGRLEQWLINAEVKKLVPKAEVNTTDLVKPEPKFSVALSAVSPLQLTITKISLQLIKTLAEAYSKEYGKKVEGSVKVQTLTGAPFTIVNKLGEGIPLYLQPGPSLKLKDRQEFAKLTNGGSLDMIRKREVWRRSYASLVSHPADENHTLGIAVGTFEKLQDIPISVPGTFYYTLQPKQDYSSPRKYGLVVDVVVTGSKKTITIRSPLQFYNHLTTDVELWTDSPKQPPFRATIKLDEVFAVPIHIAHSGDNFYITPAGFGLQPDGAPISWLQKPETKYLQVRSKLEGDDSACHFTRVEYKEENYKLRKNVPVGDFPHHIFHLHPPLVIQNLLPFNISVGSLESGCPMRSIEPGKYLHFHDLDLEVESLLIVTVEVPDEEPLKGKFKLSKKPPEYSNFAVSASGNIVDLSVHTEDLAYMKVDIFSPFWMINKTGLTLEYKEGSKITRHPPKKTIQLLSTSNSKFKIQLGAFTAHGSHTDWTKSFPINAIGSSGNFTAKLGENSYKFGVEIRLSQFTLTKLVIVTPYYVLVNETEVHLQSWESDYNGLPTQIPPGEVVPFWPLSETNRMVVTAGMGEKTAAFNYKNSDFIVLKIDNELIALCVEVQESESATTVTFSPYYPGCTPVQIVNHFPDLTLQFRQDSKSSQAITHTLGPQETLFYTWDDQAGRKIIKWDLVGVKVSSGKPIDISKDAQEAFNIKIEAPKTPTTTGSLLLSPPPRPGIGDTWLEVDESFSEQLVSIEPAEGETCSNSSYSDSPRGSLASLNSQRGSRGSVGGLRAHWKTFINGLQRTLIFTPDVGVIDQIQAGNSYSVPQLEVSLSLRAVGLSLVDNHKKRELAYIAVTQSGVIWQVEKGKGRWKTLNNTVIELLEEAHQNKRLDIKHKNLVVNMATMEMYSPVEGKLRRTHHDGVFFKFAMSDTDYSIHAKIGYLQVDNQLPFSVYPQVLYPLPPPPTVAPATEPKPFVEASIILRKTDEQSNVKHLKYVHVLVQKMAVNVDLGFILALVDFFSLKSADAILETEYVLSDIEYAGKSLKETLIPELSDDFEIARTFFDVLHLAPIKITLSFNIRSVGKNKSDDEITVGDRFLELFLHSVGVILTSVQETEMKFSCFHLEYQTLTGNGLTNLLIKHYRTQALFQLHTLIFGLDVLGNPVSVVRGVVSGAIDLFYEPIKGSVLGPEEFFEGLGLGLRSFFGAGVVGGLTGAGARITGAFGDVFAKLTFDDEFIDKRQVEKARPPKLGSKLGGFAKNLFEGVTGVVTQPVKGLQKEGAVGLLKGTGRGLVGLLVRPTGGLVDLASGTLDFVTRKTQIGSFEISDIRPPRHIGRDGVVKPYSPHKALGTALLVSVDEGKFVESDYYFGHIQISDRSFVLVTDRRLMVIERKLLTEGWKSVGIAKFKRMASAVEVKDTNVIICYPPQWKGQKLHHISVRSGELASEIASVINQSYLLYASERMGEWGLV